MDEYTAFPLLQRLRTTLIKHLPYCSGILEVPSDNFEIYYGKKDARFVNLRKASKSYDQDALETLSKACEPAKFGRGEETVLDETYRKAGKMDPKKFVTRLDVEATGLLDGVRLGLLSRKDEKRTVRAELYKLNVYGEGAFFKPHKDTPRSQSMFGSLVIVFPTPHEGGALILRHDDGEFTFDAAALLSEYTHSIAYVAFFSDVEHEVAPVVSGHRVTLTYNLYYGAHRTTTPSDDLEVLQPPHASVSAVKDALASLLADPTFMPEGGTLGFGLRHYYPFPKSWTRRMEDPLQSLEAWLKGSDAALFDACDTLGLAPDLRLISKGVDCEFMLHHMVELGNEVENVGYALFAGGDVVLLHSFDFTGEKEEPWSDSRAQRHGWLHEFWETTRRTVYWLTQSADGPASPYVAYGNEATLEWLYLRVGMLVTIEPYGRRMEEGEDGMEVV